MSPRLVLASGSPRRKRLLEEAGYRFDVAPTHADETPPAGTAPREVARILAERKARAAHAAPGDVVLAADTLLDFHGRIVGKPRDAEDARRILLALSATWHEVITGVAVRRGDDVHAETVVTRVLFKALSPQEIGLYVETGEPMDKAGAYAVQGGAAAFVDKLQGPLDNVVGLPMDATRRLLAQAGVTPLKAP